MKRIQRAGGSSTLQITGGVFHVWHMLDGVLPEARQALVRVADFLEKTKGPAGQSRALCKPRRRAS